MVITALFIGAFIGAMVMWTALLDEVRTAKQAKNVNYKERWRAAVVLLGETGQLTAEQVKTITAPKAAKTRAQPAAQPVQPARPIQQRPVERLSADPSHAARQRQLRGMATWDRAAIEVERAKNGLPPVDDLAGMATWDKADVLKARARYGTG